MISEEEKMAAVKMFCAYCKRTLRNARTDIIRKQAREARWETVFSDMHESELNRLASPDDLISEEVVVMDTVLAEAIHGLSKGDQAIVLLYYFAEWTDRRIAEELGCPRSTVQFRRSKALLALRARLEEVIGDDEL
jgi:RNA polymerase sigma factor (sigma-70 family)